MPETGRSITVADAIDHVRARAFTTDQGAVGAEVEWVVIDPADRLARPPLEVISPLASSAARTRVTFEPGGQIELSSEPGSLAQVNGAIAADEADMLRAVRGAGFDIMGIGLDPVRRDRRLVFGPRYDAMERFFDADGPEGRRMMCGTASIQINVDAGTGECVNERWRRAHAIGPVMIAAFANSPFALGRPTGWRSTRMANWFRMDRTRTRPALSAGFAHDDWARYALGANVMMMRNGEGFTPPEERISFRDWIARGYAGLHPTLDDLDYHITTLFPPVRARGWLEIRYLDALPTPWWRAAVATVVALMDDPAAAERATTVCEPLADRWIEAAREGARDPSLRSAALECFDAASDALPRLGADADTIAALAGFVEAFTVRGRCPADVLLERPGAEPALVAG